MDPILSLAFSVHANKGVYALLLGSGISRSAGIPTGWEVVLDLIRKLARMAGEECEPRPDEWYRAKFGEEPNYSLILDRVAKTPAERQQLLKSYFEPTEEERAQGLKVPTPAHHAVAALVAGGFIRVIVTTNFDRLMEKALDSAGVSPAVISTTDAVAGSLPLIHTACTVIKANGDYLDTRIKNTPEELKRYDEPLTKLLERVADEFGLIVCGWSGDYDEALSGIITRCPTWRFTTYWAARGHVGDKASRLASLRRAQIIAIESADAFLQDLTDKVQSLEEINRPHPLSAKVAAATLKRYIAEDRHRIRLHDLVMNETVKLHAELTSDQFPVNGHKPKWDEIKGRVQRYEALTEVLLALFVQGCYWGGETDEYLWQKSVERVAEHDGPRDGMSVYLKMRKYPALLLTYAGGLAALAAGKYGNLAALLLRAAGRQPESGREAPVAMFLNAYDVFHDNVAPALLDDDRGAETPASEYLFRTLREPLRELLPGDAQYEKLFDKFEYLWSLIWLDLDNEGLSLGGSKVTGRYLWRDRARYEGQKTVLDELVGDIKGEHGVWPGLSAGLFGDSPQRLWATIKYFQGILPELRRSLNIRT